MPTDDLPEAFHVTTDEQLRAVAERGGVVGVATFADFVADTTKGKPNVEQLLDHIDFAVTCWAYPGSPGPSILVIG